MKCSICGHDSVSDASTPEDPYPCMNVNCGVEGDGSGVWRYKRALKEIIAYCDLSVPTERFLHIKSLAEEALKGHHD